MSQETKELLNALKRIIDAELDPIEEKRNKPLRLPIQGVMHTKELGSVFMGRVEYGILKKGAKIIFQPSGDVAEVTKIEQHWEEKLSIGPNNSIGFACKKFPIDDLYKYDSSRGDSRAGFVASPASAPASKVKKFTALIKIRDELSFEMLNFYLQLHMHTIAQLSVRILDIIDEIDATDGSIVDESPDKFYKDRFYRVTIECPVFICAESYRDFFDISGFVLRYGNRTLALGIVNNLLTADIS